MPNDDDDKAMSSGQCQVDDVESMDRKLSTQEIILKYSLLQFSTSTTCCNGLCMKATAIYL